MIELGTYSGGKGSVFRHIINEMPPHDTFVAAFVGGGAVTLNKRPARRNILIDRDPEVIESWLSHLAVNCGISSPKVTMAAAIVKNSDASGRIVESGDGTRWELYVDDAVQLLPRLQLGPSALVYADPPYLYSVRSQKRPLYKFEMGAEDEHAAMIELFRSLGCQVMISGYWSEFYDELLGDAWRSFWFAAYDRARNLRTEYVWCNFPEPTRLHDYQWLGENFRERERIGRKAARWVSRFQQLPVLERRRILAELEEAGVLR